MALFENKPDVEELAAPGDTSLTPRVQTVHMASNRHDIHSSIAVSTTHGLWAPDLDDLLVPVKQRHIRNGGKSVEF